MDPEHIILYGDLFFNHIIYDLSINEVLNLLFVNKKFNKSIIDKWMKQIIWKMSKFEGYEQKEVRTTLTRKNTILSGNFVMSCLCDICSKDKITILNIETYNPYKKGLQNSKYEDYEQHRFEQLMLKIQCINNWEYEPVYKTFPYDKINKNMRVWIDRAGCIEGPALITGKQISINNLDENVQYDSVYSGYNFLSVNKDHPYLTNFKESELYSEFNSFTQCIKQHEFKIYEIHNLQYFRNSSTGQLDDIIGQLGHDSDHCQKVFGKYIYKSGEICGSEVRLKRSERCDRDNCPVKKYGGIINKHYHFFDNDYNGSNGQYAEYVFVVKD